MSALSWWKRIRTARRRVVIEDALKHLHACEWEGRAATTESLSGAIGLSARAAVRLCAHMQSQGLIRPTAGGLKLTPAGVELAVDVIRAHRLWERYLADEARMPLAKIHAVADRREHARDPDSIQVLDAAMGHPRVDPHGDPIPTADGQLTRTPSQTLTDWPIGEPAVIVHLEDEPKAVFDQIASQGLRPGLQITILDRDEQRITIAGDDDRTYILAPVVAGNVFVTSAEPIEDGATIDRLTSLRSGDVATVHRLDDTLGGFTRRRLLDLGLTPGAEITAEYASFLGDPVAYRVRGSLIALRRHQAEHILIRTNGVNGENRDG